MHQRLQIGYHLQVDRETVRLILKVLDPDGVETRSRRRLQRRKYRSKGPDYIWHIDGYDKLKPFGFCIHDAIDGHSRRILWLRVCLVPRPHYFARPKRLGTRGHARSPRRRHRNELSDSDWENAVQGLGKLQVCPSNNDPWIFCRFLPNVHSLAWKNSNYCSRRLWYRKCRCCPHSAPSEGKSQRLFHRSRLIIACLV